MILVVDNYDSFTFNLVQALASLGADTRVVRNDQVSAEDIVRLAPRALVLSPGPGRPEEAGVTPLLVRTLAGRLPILGVCLGHQAIGLVHGARIVRAREPVHGKASAIHHHRRGLFRDLPSPFLAGRYHSLVIERASLPPALEVTAQGEDGTVMAIAHRRLPLWGVQFHPESILTPLGAKLLRSFLDDVHLERGAL